MCFLQLRCYSKRELRSIRLTKKTTLILADVVQIKKWLEVTTNSRDACGRNDLHCAIALGNRKTALYLVSRCNTSTVARDHEGRTPMDYASLANDTHMLRAIVNYLAQQTSRWVDHPSTRSPATISRHLRPVPRGQCNRRRTKQPKQRRPDRTTSRLTLHAGLKRNSGLPKPLGLISDSYFHLSSIL